ncbi:acyl-CoA thioesterase [Qiania dongpingensis]|uniref:Acyl-CoA thioesterase n=1 Tax=Qiania dongpingensis TaxID=2763669 RepID=A0A7G9G2K7_9FIRM|nr:thioesterase family protein [Qiania dongpingensis]QNM05039.1 acyl-CoA thioesterase [Qiania dongpingensis]
MDYRIYEKRAQYYETDQMGVVHHSNYIRWFEEARVDFLERAGAGYREMEEIGVISPVVSVSCQYRSMVRFHDLVQIELKIISYNGVKLCLAYEVRDKDTGTVRCTGESSHCFLGEEGKPISLKKEYPKYHELLAAWTQVFKDRDKKAEYAEDK